MHRGPEAAARADEGRQRATTRAYVPLFWRVLALNAVLVTAVVVAVAAVLPEHLSRIAADEAAILAAALVVTLGANALLLRRALTPVSRVAALLRRVDPLQSGERLRVPTTPSEAADLARSYNHMLDELESERRDSARRVLLAQEDERLRVAQELHDEIGQTLTGMLLVLARLAAEAPPELQEQLRDLAETARGSADDMRRIAQRLRPEALDELGLTGALASLCRRLEEHSDLRVACELPPRLVELSPEVELVVFRVAQEALTNAIRHAAATRVRLILTCAGAALTLSVRDDGRGLPAQRREGGGLRGMRERAALVSGHLRLDSGEGQGTLVTLEVPLEREL